MLHHLLNGYMIFIWANSFAKGLNGIKLNISILYRTSFFLIWIVILKLFLKCKESCRESVKSQIYPNKKELSNELCIIINISFFDRTPSGLKASRCGRLARYAHINARIARIGAHCTGLIIFQNYEIILP